MFEKCMSDDTDEDTCDDNFEDYLGDLEKLKNYIGDKTHLCRIGDWTQMYRHKISDIGVGKIKCFSTHNNFGVCNKLFVNGKECLGEFKFIYETTSVDIETDHISAIFSLDVDKELTKIKVIAFLFKNKSD